MRCFIVAFATAYLLSTGAVADSGKLSPGKPAGVKPAMMSERSDALLLTGIGLTTAVIAIVVLVPGGGGPQTTTSSSP